MIPDPTPVPTASAGGASTVVTADRLLVRLTSLRAIHVTADSPGDVDGEAVRVGVEIENTGDASVSVDAAAVQLVGADGAWGVGTSAGGAKPLLGSIAPGASRAGTYVFMLPAATARSVAVTVIPTAGAAVAVLEGEVS